MKPTGTPKTLFALVAALLVVPFGALAQEEYASVRNLEGSAQVVGARDSQPQDLTLNTPLMEGDTLWTGRSGRLDMFLQDGNHVWLDYDSRLEITQLPSLDPAERRALQARLWKGAALLDLQADPVGAVAYWVVTPSATITALDRGLYLIEVENVDRTRVTALEGRCDVTSSGQTVRLERMQMTYSEYGYAPTPGRNSGAMPAASLIAFRDDHLPRPVRGGESRRYLPENLAAYSADFDNYGTWNYTGTYGYVWRPSPAYISTGWAPYRHGRWCYRPWGVTWVPFEPWGWCHSHFGRWIFTVGFGWGWVPGYVFSPAWVSWYWGDGWIGWSPWGWDGPSWGHQGWCSVNITNLYVNNITNVIVNHTEAPPVQPIRPQPPLHKPPDSGKQWGDGVHRGDLVDNGGIHISPRDIDDYRNGRIDLAGLRKGLDRPSGISSGPHSSSPGSDRPWGEMGTRPTSGPSSTGPGVSPRPVRGDKEGGTLGTSPRVEPLPRTQPGTNPRYEPPTISPRTEPSPRVEPSPRTQPGTNPRSEPPTISPRYEPPTPSPRYEPPATSPRYEPPTPSPRYEPPAPSPRYEPPTPSPRYEPPAPSPRYEPPAPSPRYEPPAPSPRYEPPAPSPRYEPPAHEAPRTVPSRVEPKPENTPPPAAPPVSGNKDKDQHRRGFRNG